MLDNGLESDPEMVVPAAEVLTLIQCTICMLGNASELVSQTRRSKVLDVIDHSWSKFGEGEFPSAKETLFGEDFQASLTTKVEKDNALSKAVSITKRNKKHETPLPVGRRGSVMTIFFEGALLPGTEAGRAKVSSRTIHIFPTGRKEKAAEGQRSLRPGYRPLYHEPRLPQEVQENPTEKAMKLLKSLPRSELKHLGIKIDMSIIRQRARLPVGGRLAHFTKHWREISYLKFRWEGQTWQFRALPFGLSSAPYVFTKLLKPVVSTLRKLGIRVILYLDDMLIISRSQEETRRNLATTVELLIALGFIEE